MGGIINVITKDPALVPRFSADVFGTTWNEWNADIGMRMGKGRVRELLGVNLFRYNDPRDINNDGFTDVALQERVSIFNKFNLQRPAHRRASLAARYVHEDRRGGQLQWTDADKGSDRIYGESINTERWEPIASTNCRRTNGCSRSSPSMAMSRILVRQGVIPRTAARFLLAGPLGARIRSAAWSARGYCLSFHLLRR